MTPLDWMTDLALCGRTFGGPTFAAARAAVAAIFGLPMTPEMLEIYQTCTGRTVAPTTQSTRATLIAGRGSGKTLLAAFVCVYLAASRDFRTILGPGELATVMLIAPDRRQSRVAFRYIRGLLMQSPLLAPLVTGETKESIELSTSCVIEIHTANFRTPRGYSIAGSVTDEASFLPTEDSANPDIELERALGPGRARVPGSLGLITTSPHAKRGLVWRDMQRHWGVDDASTLVWQAPTRAMNPTISEQVVAAALEDDPVAARSEWLAEFRDDIASYIDLDTLRAVVVPGRVSLPHATSTTELAFTDAATGGGKDCWATAAGYYDADGRCIQTDFLEFTPPFSPEICAAVLGDWLRTRNIHRIVGDRFAGLWIVERMKAHGITLDPAPMPKSQLYLEALPIITSGRCELLDHAKTLRQFTQLERRASRSGGTRDVVDHAYRGGQSAMRDDASNAVAGLLVTLANEARAVRPGLLEITGF